MSYTIKYRFGKQDQFSYAHVDFDELADELAYLCEMNAYVEGVTHEESFTNDRDISVNGTSLMGEVEVYYNDLVTTFGEPTFGPGDDLDKVTCEWNLRFDDGTVATIYDWKMPETPMGLYRWHIGGRDYKAVDKVRNTLRNEGVLTF
jgi:hypothetical protein